ncbi:MAG: lipid A deacylase LpxR family protein [Chitinophagaceae bacterium]|nr:lipid A deacylase LpxR family protein [Chitinophagaceae bacterium]MCW5904811.1 lipid A deacylase LpxR family protein [Chitinophagaceae bacterium]
MKPYFTLLYLFITLFAIAQKQKSYSSEFSFINENDVYLLQHRDSYYTNGFFLQYSKASIKKNHKIINRYSLGQNIYTVGDRKATYNGFAPFDRPYCGYLFARFTKDKFAHSGSLLSLSAEVGVTGDLSLARQLQIGYHNLINVFSQPFWDKQIPNQIGINAGIKYAASIYSTQKEENKFDIVPIISANAGTLFINAQAGAYFCFGRIENMHNSILFNAAIDKNNSTKKYNHELFFYFYPQIIYQAYNTTVQGNMFKKPTNPIVFVTDVMPLMYQQTMGIAFAKNRWTSKIELVYQTKEAITQIQNHQYIGWHVAYRF